MVNIKFSSVQFRLASVWVWVCVREEMNESILNVQKFMSSIHKKMRVYVLYVLCVYACNILFHRRSSFSGHGNHPLLLVFMPNMTLLMYLNSCTGNSLGNICTSLGSQSSGFHMPIFYSLDLFWLTIRDSRGFVPYLAVCLKPLPAAMVAFR